jgi:predicted deacetylase
MRHARATVKTKFLYSLRKKEKVMNCHQLIENWNEQVARFCNRTIGRLESAADKGDVKATQTDYRLRSVKARKHAGQE